LQADAAILQHSLTIEQLHKRCKDYKRKSGANNPVALQFLRSLAQQHYVGDSAASTEEAVKYLSKALRLCNEQPAGAVWTPRYRSLEELAMRIGIMFELADAQIGLGRSRVLM